MNRPARGARDLPDSDTQTFDSPPAASGGPGEQAEKSSPPAQAKRDPRAGEAPGMRPFSSEEIERFRQQWRELQGDFIDDPQAAVRSADQLVGQTLETLTAALAEHKRTLENRWARDGDADTEESRLALRSYRTFLNQLLSTSSDRSA